MSRYIDADKIEYFALSGYGLTNKQFAHKPQIDEIPTADVEHIVHAHWQDKVTQIGIPKYHYIVCPECSSGYNIVYVHLLIGDGKLFNRCPECGAKMGEGGDDE